MWSRSSPTRQFPFRAVSTSTRCPLACRSPAVFAATASSWTRPRRWNRPLPTSQGSDARAPTLASSPGLRSTSNRLRPTRPYRPRPLNADFRPSLCRHNGLRSDSKGANKSQSRPPPSRYDLGPVNSLVERYVLDIRKRHGRKHPEPARMVGNDLGAELVRLKEHVLPQ